MFPAQWTDYEGERQEKGACIHEKIGVASDFIKLCRIVDPLLRKLKQDSREYASDPKEANHATRVSNHGFGKNKRGHLGEGRKEGKGRRDRNARKTNRKSISQHKKKGK
jgi:hypothetical protein